MNQGRLSIPSAVPTDSPHVVQRSPSRVGLPEDAFKFPGPSVVRVVLVRSGGCALCRRIEAVQ